VSIEQQLADSHPSMAERSGESTRFDMRFADRQLGMQSTPKGT
jgi:hypothetical protein